MNPHAPDGTLLTDAQVHVVEMEPSTAGYLADQQAAAAERFMADVNQLDDLDQGLASARPTTEQRCQECGFKTAYYWTRQVMLCPIFCAVRGARQPVACLVRGTGQEASRASGGDGG